MVRLFTRDRAICRDRHWLAAGRMSFEAAAVLKTQPKIFKDSRSQLARFTTYHLLRGRFRQNAGAGVTAGSAGRPPFLQFGADEWSPDQADEH